MSRKNLAAIQKCRNLFTDTMRSVGGIHGSGVLWRLKREGGHVMSDQADLVHMHQGSCIPPARTRGWLASLLMGWPVQTWTKGWPM